MLIAVNFHYVRPSFETRFPAIHGLTPEEFERQVITLGRMGTFVDADAIRAAVDGSRPLPDRAIVLTFDDGLREQYEHAWPILRRLGVPAIFFINTAPLMEGRVSTVHKLHLLRAALAPEVVMRLLERHARATDIRLDHAIDPERVRVQYEYDTPEVGRLKFLLNLVLTPPERSQLIDRCFAEHVQGDEAGISRRLYMELDQVRCLGRARAVGAHGHEHEPLGLLTIAAADGQIDMCCAWLEPFAGYRPFAFSYPYGERAACSGHAAAVARRRGIAFAFTMERAANHDLRRPLHLARFDSNDLPGGRRPYWNAAEFFSQAPAACWFS